MLRILAMIGPILLPSWRFFKTVAPSPRIEWCVLDQGLGQAAIWHPFRPRPKRMPIGRMLFRLIWNPTWNETLYLVSCSERVAQDANAHAVAEIKKRIAQSLQNAGASGFFRFRLIFVSRRCEAVEKEVLFVSEDYAVPEAT